MGRRVTQAGTWLLGAGLMGAVLLLGPAGPASAHDGIVGTEPADGAVLDAAPSAVTLTFAADQLAVGAAVAVTGSDGSTWAHGAPVVTGTTVTQALSSPMPSGTFAVEWRSVSGDGHPVTGTFAFTLALPVPVRATPTPSPAATSQAAAAPALAPSPEAPEPTPEATPVAAEDGTTPERASFTGGAVAALGAGLLAAAGAVVALRRRGRAA